PSLLKWLWNNNNCVMASGSRTKIDPICLFTDRSKKCPHCWFLHPEQCPPRPPRLSGSKVEVTVSSFHPTLSVSPSSFILDLGLSAHMACNSKIFWSIEYKNLGTVKKRSGLDNLRIKGVSSIRLTNEYGEVFLNQVLYVPDMLVKLLSARCLFWDDFEVNFQKNFLEIIKSGEIKMQGKYIGNLPGLDFQQNQKRK
ncbi:hypothetical protein VP01_281g2, partial [Puccinia sorghi]